MLACCLVFNILQRILYPVLWCFTCHLSPLISTPGSVISISPPFPSPPFLSHSVFQASFSLPSRVSLITSTPLIFFFFLFPTCTLHNFSPSSLDSRVLLDAFHPSLCFLFFSPFTIVITFSVLSVWLSCYRCSSNKFSWQSLFLILTFTPHPSFSKSTVCHLLLFGATVYFPFSSFSSDCPPNCSYASCQNTPFPLALSHSASLAPLLLSCYHVCGLSLCAHLMAGV